MSVFTFCVSHKLFSFSHLLGKNLVFNATTNITITSNNFNKFLSFRIYFFKFNNNVRITHMTTSNSPCLCHLNTNILFIVRRCTRLNISIFFLFRFEKLKFDIYIYLHIILAKNCYVLLPVLVI